MSDSIRCPKCDSKLPADAPVGLCPACLVRAGFESQSSPAPDPGPTLLSPVSAGFEPPSIDELSDKFPQLEILELLGKGGMGAVYKARQPGLDRFVAVKILPPEVARDPAFAERFLREARALARLSHPNIVAVHDFGQTGGLYYFVMEMIDGANLRQAMQASQLQPQQALSLVPQICDALQYAHDEGVVHRDIKPENILLDKRGRVKIADFGLSKLMASGSGETPDISLTGTHQVMGTIRYMAPEQMQGTKGVDHRADIYSLGVVFYEMLTGELPMGRFASPSQKVAVDVRLDEVVLRALEQEPQRRYQQAGEVKTDIERISQSPLRSNAAFSQSVNGVTDAAGPQQPFATHVAPDSVVFRRLSVMNLLAGLVWAALLGGLQWGYLAGADWYFKKELPYGLLTALWLNASVWLAGSLASWSYLLAKQPDAPRSFADFWRMLQTPDPRMMLVWKPVLTYAGLWVLSVVVAWGYGDVAQTISLTTGFVLAPFVCMGIMWHTFAERYAQLIDKTEVPWSPPRRPPSFVGPPRFSRFAIFGAVWALFGLLSVIPTLFFIAMNRVWNGTALPTDLVYEQPPLPFLIFMILLLAIGSGAPIGTTILGAIAIAKIKRSGGMLIGLPLAVADVIFFPLLLFGGLIAFLVAQVFAAFAPQPNATALISGESFGVLVTMVVCFFVSRSVWRAIRPNSVNSARKRAADSWTDLEIGTTAAVAIAFLIAAVKGIYELAQQPSPLDVFGVLVTALASVAAGILLVVHQFRRPVDSRASLPELLIAILSACAGSLPWTAAFSPIAGWNFWQGTVFASLNFALSLFLLMIGTSYPRMRSIATLLVGLFGFTLVMWFNIGPVGVIGSEFLATITRKPGLPGMFIAAALGLLSMIAGALQLRNQTEKQRGHSRDIL